MKVLVTGGAGFIGSHSVEALCRHGHDVVVLDNFSTGKRGNIASVADVVVSTSDIRDFDGLVALLRANPVDAILHLAALTSDPMSVEQPRDFHDVNLTGTLNVLDAARVCGVGRAVLASSSAVYGSGGKCAFERRRGLGACNTLWSPEIPRRAVCRIVLRPLRTGHDLPAVF